MPSPVVGRLMHPATTPVAPEDAPASPLGLALLEHDDDPSAVIEPTRVITARDVPECAVMCFFAEVVDALSRRADARQVARLRAAHGIHGIWEIGFAGQRLAVFHPGMGAPLAVAFFEGAIAYGCRKFVTCGGAGALVPELVLGHAVVLDSAVRDEGTSFHYLPPGRVVEADPGAVSALGSVLERHGVPCVTGRSWTTDAVYRETPSRVERRRQEGCITVEMEAAALFAVARFRGVRLGQLLYAGDSLAKDEWDKRNWHRQTDVRERLFWLAAESCLAL